MSRPKDELHDAYFRSDVASLAAFNGAACYREWPSAVLFDYTEEQKALTDAADAEVERLRAECSTPAQ